jgi:hypothetical protein
MYRWIMDSTYKGSGRSKKGQLTILDLVLIPIVAVVLSILFVYFVQAQTANIINAVDQAPAAQSCNFALDSLYGNYYVDTPAALNTLSLLHPNQYQTALSSQKSQLYANCGPSCTLGYSVLSSSLTNFTSLYSDFINYFSSFSFSAFQNIMGANSNLLLSLHTTVYLNQVPPTITAATACSLTVYNPANPSNPYTIYGIMN